jgi:hypothetical protein
MLSKAFLYTITPYYFREAGRYSCSLIFMLPAGVFSKSVSAVCALQVRRFLSLY